MQVLSCSLLAGRSSMCFFLFPRSRFYHTGSPFPFSAFDTVVPTVGGRRHRKLYIGDIESDIQHRSFCGTKGFLLRYRARHAIDI